MKGVKGQGPEEGVKGVKGVKGGFEASVLFYASIPGRSSLGLNSSRQVRTGPEFQAGPDWAYMPSPS